MPFCGNDGLRHENVITYRAMTACGKAGGRAAGCDRIVYYYRMPVSFYDLLRDKHGLTYRAMAALGITYLCTRGRYRVVRYLGVAERASDVGYSVLCASARSIQIAVFVPSSVHVASLFFT